MRAGRPAWLSERAFRIVRVTALVMLIAGAVEGGLATRTLGNGLGVGAGAPEQDHALSPILAKPPMWAEDFVRPPSAADWDRGYTPWPDTIGNRVLFASKEAQVYTDAKYLNRDLLAWRPGQISLVATRMTAADRAAIDRRISQENVAPGAVVALQRATWVSTLLKGRNAFQYGYVEARMRWDGDRSAFPAFWLLPKRHAWPPEIDILEIPGDATAHQTLHSLPGDPKPHPTVQTPINTGFNTYGVLWRPDVIVFYVNRQRTACFATPTDMHEPMYPLLNLAVGGWARAPDDNTPARLAADVTYVKWWRLPEPLPKPSAIGCDQSVTAAPNAG